MITITGDIRLPESEVEEHFVRATGPGGQNVNKLATAVQVRFDVSVSSLPPDLKQRLIALEDGASALTACCSSTAGSIVLRRRIERRRAVA